jgi:hypothetical protein
VLCIIHLHVIKSSNAIYDVERSDKDSPFAKELRAAL